MGRITFGLVLVFLLCSACGPDLKQYEHLKTPVITNKPAQRMLVVYCTGGYQYLDVIITKINFYFGDFWNSLFGYNIPRARWIMNDSSDIRQWVSCWGIPIGDKKLKIPEMETIESNVTLEYKIETWYGGEVAEILHIGRYENLISTDWRLMRHIETNGYITNSHHEEEYIIYNQQGSPNSDKNWTILRYEVKKRE